MGGMGAMAAISGSSSSSEPWHRRQRLLVVRNCTNRQRSQRTTSLESTGARVVAIRLWECQSRLLLESCNVLRFPTSCVICGIEAVEVKGNLLVNRGSGE